MLEEKEIKLEKEKYENKLLIQKRKRILHLTLIILEIEGLFLFLLHYYFLILLVISIYLGIKKLIKIHKSIKLLYITIDFLEVALDPKKIEAIPEEIRKSFKD